MVDEIMAFGRSRYAKAEWSSMDESSIATLESSVVASLRDWEIAVIS